MKTAELTPDTPATLQYTPEFQTSEFVIRGDRDVVVAVDEQLTALEADLLKHQPVAIVEPPISRPKAEMVQVTDLSLLAPREVVRRKISAKLYDLSHGSNMYGMFTEKLQEDRNVRFAMQLGIITTDRCAKHEKIAAKLAKLAN